MWDKVMLFFVFVFENDDGFENLEFFKVED